MEILIETSGQARCIYGEAIDLAQLGSLTIRRGSHVEPDQQGRWLCDLSPVSGPTLGAGLDTGQRRAGTAISRRFRGPLSAHLIPAAQHSSLRWRGCLSTG